MTRTRRNQLLVFLLIVILGQWTGNSWDVHWREVVVSKNGRIFTVSKYRGQLGAEIWEWKSDLSSRRHVAELWNFYGRLHCSKDGSILVCDTGSSVFAVDTATNQRLWENENSVFRRVHLLDDDRHGVFVAIEGMQIIFLQVFDIRTGQIKDKFTDLPIQANDPMGQVHLIEDGIAFCGSKGQNATVRWTGNEMFRADLAASKSELAGARTLYDVGPRYRGLNTKQSRTGELPNGRMVEVQNASADKSCRIMINNDVGNRIESIKRIGLSPNWWLASAIAFVALGVFWVHLLMRDAVATGMPSRLRLLIDLSWITLTLAFVTTPGLGEFVPDGLIQIRLWHVTAFASAVLVWSIYSLVAGLRKPSYVWALLIGSCAVPVVLPPVLLALWWRKLGFTSRFWFREPCDQSSTEDQPAKGENLGFRFGIREVLLVTAAIAVFAGVGIQTAEFFTAGLGYALVVLLAFALGSGNRTAKATVLICSLIALAAVASHGVRGEGAWASLHTVHVVLVFSFASVYGYGFARTEVANRAIASESLAASVQ